MPKQPGNLGQTCIPICSSCFNLYYGAFGTRKP